MSRLQRVVIFGITSAIAAAVARQLVVQGASIFGVGRNELKLRSVLDDLRARAGVQQAIDGATADLDDLALHEALFDSAQRALGGVDAVLVAHGTLPDQLQCQESVRETVVQVQTNAVSAIALLTIAARRFEAQGSGLIAAISSVAGDRGRQSNYVYGAAKAMLSTFMDGLRHRLYAKRIPVVTIKPGFVDTPMTAHFANKGALWASPDEVARGIVRAMQRGRSVAYLPRFWRPLMFVIRHLPEPIFLRLRL
jgi:decaprenylphospho-beta-D-erythro-pentofuranosid-2-ulose 2-reductase